MDKILSSEKSLSYTFLTSEERTPLDKITYPNVYVIQRFQCMYSIYSQGSI